MQFTFSMLGVQCAALGHNLIGRVSMMVVCIREVRSVNTSGVLDLVGSTQCEYRWCSGLGRNFTSVLKISPRNPTTGYAFQNIMCSLLEKTSHKEGMRETRA